MPQINLKKLLNLNFKIVLNYNKDINNLKECFTLFEKNISFFHNCYIYNSKNSIFLTKSHEKIGRLKGSLNVILKILKNNKIEEIKITRENIESLNSSNNLNSLKNTENKTEKKSNNIISPFYCLFKDKINNKIESNLSYEDFVISFREKYNNTYQINTDGNISFGNTIIILDNDYILILLDNLDFVNKNWISEDDFKKDLIFLRKASISSK